MATYNGEKYILEQLTSIYQQTLQPDEVIIQDDGSTDNTENIVQNFIKEHKLEHWKYLKNKKNLGWRKNFIHLMEKATGEIVFLSDQDDIWYEKKIEKMARVFEENNEVLVLSHDYEEFFEEGGTPEPSRIHHLVDKGNVKFALCCEKNFIKVRVGWTLALKRTFIPTIVRTWENDETIPHDQVAWFGALLFDGAFILPENLGAWRKHGESTFRKEIKESLVQSNAMKHNKVKVIEHFQTRADLMKCLDKVLRQELEIAKLQEKRILIAKLEKKAENNQSRLEKKKIFSILFHKKDYERNVYWIRSMAFCFEFPLKMYYKIRGKKV